MKKQNKIEFTRRILQDLQKAASELAKAKHHQEQAIKILDKAFLRELDSKRKVDV